jgi:hypothetical protein
MDYGPGYGDASAFFSIFLAIELFVIGFVLLISAVVYVLNGFAFMKLFRKVGVEPWAAWVPIFNFWRLLELGGQPGWISLLALVSPASIVAVVFEAIAAYRVGLAFRKDGAWVVLFIFFPFAWAWSMAADGLPYEPQLYAQHGYGPPTVGYGSPRGPYVPPTYTAPPAPPAA